MQIPFRWGESQTDFRMGNPVCVGDHSARFLCIATDSSVTKSGIFAPKWYF
jgi:hypothetical protein